MTVSSTTTKAQYSGNGTTTVFAVPFYFLLNSDLLVILRSSAGVETTQVLTTNYTVTGAGNEAGGSITMLVAPPTGTTLTILRNAPATQETDLIPNDRLPAESLEDALDKLTMLVQQIDEESARSLKFAATDSSTATTLPTSPNRANKFLSFDNSGNPIVVGATDTYTVSEEVKIATQGQTVFTLTTMSYIPGISNLSVFVDGVNQYLGSSYTETNSTTVTFSQGLHVGAVVKFSTVRNLTSGSADSSSVTFLQAGNGAVTRSVQSKLRESVSVKDFGAVGDGTTDDTVAIQAAINSGAQKVIFPKGEYKTTAPLLVPSNSYLFGEMATIKKYGATQYSGVDAIIYLSGSVVSRVRIIGFNLTTDQAVPYTATAIHNGTVITDIELQNIKASSIFYGLRLAGGYQVSIDNFTANACYTGVYIDPTGSAATNMTSIFASNLNVSNAGHGLFLKKVIYSSFSGYVFGIKTSNSDLFVANQTPVAIQTELCSGLKLHYGGEDIIGIFHASTGSNGEATFYLAAAAANEQFLPNAARTANGFAIAEQTYFNYTSGSWALIGCQISIGNVAWTYPANPSTFLRLNASGYVKFQNGYVLLSTGVVDAATGANAAKGFAVENTRFLSNYQTANSNRLFNIGNNFLVYSDAVTFNTSTTEHTITFPYAFDQVFYGSAVVVRNSSTIIGAQIKSISTSSITFIFENDVNGFQVRFLVFGVAPAA